MRRGIQVFAVTLLLIISLISLVSAASTVMVKTEEGNLVSIEFTDTTKYENTLKAFIETAGSAGTASATYSPTDEFNLHIFISENKSFVVPLTRLGPFEPGNNFNFGVVDGELVELAPPASECTENWTCGDWDECSSDGNQTMVCTDSNECGTEADKPAELQDCEAPKSALTGFAIGIKDSINGFREKIRWSYILYGLLGVVVIGGIVVLVIKKPFNPGKLLILQKKEKPMMDSLDMGRLEAAEEKIKEAQEDIEEIKDAKDNKLSDAEKQYKEAKEKLDKIKEKVEDSKNED